MVSTAISITQQRFSVEGRSILVTGATGALGQAAAKGLADAGARLTLAGANAAGLEALAASLPVEVRLVVRRPESESDADAIVAAAVSAYGRLDGVLVASGMNKVSPIVDMPLEMFESVMDANVRGSWLVCKSAGRQLLAQAQAENQESAGAGAGSIILVSSTRGKLGHPAGYTAYCPSKAAVDLLTKTLAAEWGKAGIRVNAIAPTVFRSELTAWMYGDDEKGRTTREAMLSRIPLGRLAEPDDFVGAVQYLLSGAAAFLTGQVIYLDGGYTAC
jgi:NAD(P)-dependent dehydrogenase (short-subunit alcohol dehydrogenase family)